MVLPIRMCSIMAPKTQKSRYNEPLILRRALFIIVIILFVNTPRGGKCEMCTLLQIMISRSRQTDWIKKLLTRFFFRISKGSKSKSKSTVLLALQEKRRRKGLHLRYNFIRRYRAKWMLGPRSGDYVREFQIVLDRVTQDGSIIYKLTPHRYENASWF